MECVASAVVGKIVELLTGVFLTSMGRGIRYLVHYKKNMNDLDAEFENLKGVRATIQGKVETANKIPEVIKEDVSDWLTSVSKKEEELDRILVDRGNIKSCFNVCSRYRLSKDSKRLLSDLSGLIDVGGKFEAVGHPAIWYTATTNFEQFQSRLSVHKQIIEALKDHKNYYIGIHGMAGTGKTRMAEEIAKQAKKENLFDEVAKAVFSQTPNLKKIQKELADCLNLSFKTDTEVGRKGELSNRLKNGKKILVIIDDIWSEEFKLEEIGIPSTDNHIKGCKVLLTSRKEDVFIKMRVLKNIPIGLLQQDEAWSLFKKTVGDFIESPHEIHSVAKQVCGECGCLPLAILVVGASLRDQKEKPVWDDALSQLNNCQGDNIEGIYEKLYSRVECSYKYLKQKDVKSCFLYCSMYPEDCEIPIDDLVMYGVGTRFLEDSSYTMKRARDRIHVLVDTLKKSHLLLQGESKEFVKMHDIIRDVAIIIASREGFLAKIGVPKWPEKDEYESCRVISLISENICVLPCQLECPELRTLLLECPDHLKAQVPDSFFKRTEKVEVLDLYIAQLPSSLLNLVNLRMLRLYGCEKVNLAFLKELRNLEILSIADSDLKEVAVEVGQLTGLRWLDLWRCEKLEMIPSGVIKGLSNMEELYIPPNFVGWGDEGSVGLDELKSLTRLTTLQIHIGDGMVLPNDLSFELLNRFKISVGRTQGFGYDEEDLGARILRLDSVTLRKEFNVLMEKAEVLFLSSLKGLKNVLHCGDGIGFLDLKHLQIKDCSDMEHLLGRPKRNLQTQGSFCKLSVLIVEGCTWKFLFYPSTARALPQLQQLDILGCRIMEEIILDDEEVMDKVIFHQLKNMRLYDLPILRSICSNTKKTSTTECNTSALAQAFFNEKVSFPVLEELWIEKLESITAIWENQLFQGSEAEEESFQQLRRITIEKCKKLVNLIPSTLISRLQNLEILSVKRCDSVGSLVEVRTVEKGSATRAPEIELLPMLMLMGLNGKEHPDHRLGVYSNLTSLTISDCRSLRNVFSSSIARNLGQLQDLTVIDCAQIEEIIAFEMGEGKEEVTDDEIIVFPQLSTMKLELQNLKSFCGSKKAAVDDDNIPQVEALFNHKVSFPVLEELWIEKLESITAIWENQLFQGSEAEEESFQQLRRITIEKCKKLVNLIPSTLISRLQNLEILSVKRCDSVGSLVEVRTVEKGSATRAPEIELLPMLMLMGLNGKEHPDHRLGVYSNLTSLTISDCRSLRNVFSSSIARNLGQLQDLTVIDCAQIEEIIAFEMGEGKEEVTDDEIIVFPQLSTMKLELQNLKSFCGSKKAAVDDDNIPQVEALFNHKVSFPVLEELWIEKLESITAIWENQLFQGSEAEEESFQQLRRITIEKCKKLVNLIPSTLISRLQNLEILSVKRCDSVGSLVEVRTVEKGSATRAPEIELLPMLMLMGLNGKEHPDHRLGVYSNLTSLTISDCRSLRNVFSSSIARNLGQLQDLTVIDCAQIEEIIAFEMGEGKEEVTDDEIIVFPQLSTMKLELQNLKSFCGSKKAAVDDDNIPQVEALFNHKVSFPVLEELWIEKLESITAIWENQLFQGSEAEEESFQQLRRITIEKCKKLVNLIPSTLISRLQNLEILSVKRCDSVGSLVEVRTVEKGSATRAPEIELLPMLMLMGLNGKEHPDHRLGVYSNLTSLTISDCRSLRNVFSSSIARNLGQLQDLTVIDCAQIEEIIAFEMGEGKEEVTDDEIIVFPQLSTMKLELQNLKSFCGSKKAAVDDDNIPQVEALFNHKVSFPVLEELWIEKLESITAIWENQLFQGSEAEEESFQQLRRITIEKCKKLVNLIPSTLISRLQNLEILSVKRCDSVGSLVEVRTVEKGSATRAPEIELLPMLMLMGLNGKEHPDHRLGVYSNLTSLTISDCRSLRNVFSSSIARNLGQLQDLTVIDCAQIEEIIAFEMGEGKEEVTDDEIIVFPQLSTMKLELQNLKSFCGSKKAAVDDDNIPQVEALFNHKVSFPVLEELWIEKLESITAIWENQLFQGSEAEEISFQQLRRITIEECEELVNLIPSTLISRLQNLEILSVKRCDSVVSLVEVRTVEKGSATRAPEIELPRLKSMDLESLPMLMLMGLNGKEHSDHRLGVYSNLTSLTISDCRSLRNVFSSSIARNLGQLQDLTVIDCAQIEEIIAFEMGEGKEEVTDDEIIVFPQLSTMKLELQNLKSFCGSKKAAVDDDNIPQVEALFNHKVKFPCLEIFEYRMNNNVKQIWNNTVPTESFCKLKTLIVECCDQLQSVARSKLLESFQDLEKLYINGCWSLEEVFKVEGGSNAEQGIVAGVRVLEVYNCSMLVNASALLQRFEVVEELSVRDCSSLEVVFNLEGLEDKERGATMSSQITKLELCSLPKLVHLGIMDSQGLLAFHNLRSLAVLRCNSLKYLFSLSMARNLTNIEHLRVDSCNAIEEIIKNEDQGGKDDDMDEIVFPKLQSMELFELANLTSFCWANNAVKLPSLQRVMLEICPKMHTFTSGRISTPVIEVHETLWGLKQKVSNLNDYVQQLLQERE